MDFINEIPQDNLKEFKKDVKDWLDLNKEIAELDKKSRELTSKAENSSGDAKRGLEAKRHQIQVQLQKLRKKRGF